MKQHYNLYKVIVALLLLSLLSACQQPAAAPLATEAAPKAQEEAITLKFFSHRFTEVAYKDVLLKQVKEYETLHPNIKIQPIEATTTDRQQKLLTMTKGGEFPDVMFIARDFGQYHPAGILLDLEPYIAKEGGETFKALYPETASTTVTDPKDGHWKALPAETQFWPYFVNVEMFESAGVKLPESRFWTTEEFLDAVNQVTKDGKYGFLNRGKQVNKEVGNWMLAQGGEFWGFADDCSTVKLTTEKNMDAMKLWIDLAKMGPPGFVERAYNDGLKIVGDQIAGSLIDIPGGMNSAIKMSEGKVKEMRPMFVPGEVKKAAMYTEAWAIGAEAAHPDEAWEFIKWLASDEKTLERMVGVGTLPATKSALAKVSEVDPQLQFIADWTEIAVPGCWEYVEGVGKINQLEIDATARIYNGEDISKVFAELEVAINAVLAGE